jgi:hypothetical protein
MENVRLMLVQSRRGQSLNPHPKIIEKQLDRQDVLLSHFDGRKSWYGYAPPEPWGGLHNCASGEVAEVFPCLQGVKSVVATTACLDSRFS